MTTIALAERRMLPDWMIRYGIRRLLNRRINIEARRATSQRQSHVAQFASELREAPIAIHTDAANEQHYEVPAEFFDLVLGPRRKYSCGYWNDSSTTLAESEDQMLQLTCERADLRNGMTVLDLGCGWGSLSLYVAENFPDCRIVGVSNSHGQRESIMRRAREAGYDNLEVITSDIREFQPDHPFDRVISIEMFEHMRNYELLLRNISNWLHDDGQLFVHVFCHRDLTYTFETDGDNDWMAKHFFTGGLMPSADLLSHFQEDLSMADQWSVNGQHYARTCEAWLNRLDEHVETVRNLFARDLGHSAAKIQIQRWRMFFMACAELFRYSAGHEWYVSHYRFMKQRGTRKPR